MWMRIVMTRDHILILQEFLTSGGCAVQCIAVFVGNMVVIASI